MSVKIQNTEYLILVLVSFLIITVFSADSFLYPINPWDDANVYLTVGKSMLHGKELYRDICDHKGPLLFLMHEGAAALSSRSYFGIYLVELVCMFFFMVYSLKIMRIFSDSKIALPLTCLIAMVTVSSDFFFYGDSVEEFSLPILSHCLYHMLLYIKTKQFPRWWEALAVGIGAGIIFWLKFNIMIFYLGALIALIVIANRNKMMAELGRVVSWIFAGVVLVTLFVILYFLQNGTLEYLWDGYFYNNLFLYNGQNSNGEPPYWWFKLIKLGIWAVLTLPIAFMKVNKDVKLLVLLSYGFLMLSFSVLTVQLYYFLVIFAYFPLFIYFFDGIRNTRPVYYCFCVIALIFTALNWNIVTLVSGTLPVKSIEMAEIINADKSDDSEVLNFSTYDTGIYILTNHLPVTKYHFMPNILSDEIRKEQAELVDNGKVKYLARRIGCVKTSHDYYDTPIPSNYKLIYDQQELFRYRFLTNPMMYLWNLGYPRVILKHIMTPDPEQQRCLLYKRCN